MGPRGPPGWAIWGAVLGATIYGFVQVNIRLVVLTKDDLTKRSSLMECCLENALSVQLFCQLDWYHKCGEKICQQGEAGCTYGHIALFDGKLWSL